MGRGFWAGSWARPRRSWGRAVWSAPQLPDNSVSQLLRRLDVELHPDEGGVGVEEKPHQGVQAGVLSAARNRPEASCPGLPRAQPGPERALEMEEGIRGPRGSGLHRKA